MNEKKKNLWAKVIEIAIVVLTAIASALGANAMTA